MSKALNNWCIVPYKNNHYVIGLDKNDNKQKIFFTTNNSKKDLLTDYIELYFSKNEIYKLYYNDFFKPTYKNKELFNWSIHYDNIYEDIVLYDDILNLVYNDISLDKIRNTLINKIIIGYRDSDMYKRSQFVTTPIVNVRMFTKYIEAFTESGSNYYLYLDELYNKKL